MNKLSLLFLAIIVIMLGGIGYLLATGGDEAGGPSPEEPVACTMDAKLCPDGSAVGRVPPSCEFAACPESVVDTPVIQADELGTVTATSSDPIEGVSTTTEGDM